MKILIADDSEFMRQILKGIILKSNLKDATIIEAEDGDDTITKINAEQPDLVLLDIIMPKKDGISVLKEVGKSASMIVMVSSVGQAEVIAEAKSLGAKDYIVKPFEAKQVTEILNALNSKQ